MQTIQFDVEDNHIDVFLTLLGNLKDGMIRNLKISKNTSENNQLHQYMQTSQFQKDKKIFQQRFDDIQSGKATTVPWDEGFSELDAYIDTVS